MFFFLGNNILFSTAALPFYIPISKAKGFQLPHILANTHFLFLKNYTHNNECEVEFHCGFDLHFLNDHWCRECFRVPIGHSYIFFGEVFIQGLCPFLHQIVCFHCGWVVEVHLLWILIPLRVYDLQYFANFRRYFLLFLEVGGVFWCTNIFNFEVHFKFWSPIYLFVVVVDFLCHMQEIITKSNVMKFFF